jgi:hypothetical protein
VAVAAEKKEQAFRQVLRAQNIESVNKLAGLSDAELIATDPSIPGREMEVSRRLCSSVHDR